MEYVKDSPYYINIDFCERQQQFHYSSPYMYSAKEDWTLIAERVNVTVAIAFDCYLNRQGFANKMSIDDVVNSFIMFRHFLSLLKKEDIHLVSRKKYKTIKDLI